jgi:putative Mn2+ efflux pump MntP
VQGVDHWIAFGLLLIVGVKMIMETSEEMEEEAFSGKRLLILAVATSIDALVAGITFNFVSVNVFSATLMIGVVTFTMSVLGAFTGRHINIFSTKVMRVVGGIAIVLIGINILIEHIFHVSI